MNTSEHKKYTFIIPRNVFTEKVTAEDGTSYYAARCDGRTGYSEESEYKALVDLFGVDVIDGNREEGLYKI